MSISLIVQSKRKSLKLRIESQWIIVRGSIHLGDCPSVRDCPHAHGVIFNHPALPLYLSRREAVRQAFTAAKRFSLFVSSFAQAFLLFPRRLACSINPALTRGSRSSLTTCERCSAPGWSSSAITAAGLAAKPRPRAILIPWSFSTGLSRKIWRITGR